MEKAKSTVENIVHQLESVRSDVVQKVDLTVREKWREFLEKHGNHVNSALEKIRVSIYVVRALN